MKSQKYIRGGKTAGQLSIFALLIFQVLFMLFAISINIALVVHDKINLQNSVDLAAYYGAMKQAETLNAIAHINYQIRQSWKLLVWRYRVLGSMYLTNQPSWGSPTSPLEREHWLPAFYNNGRDNVHQKPGPYFFCVGHPNWQHQGQGTGDDETCNNIDSTISTLALPRTRGIGAVGAMLGIHDQERQIRAANSQLINNCNYYSLQSWLLGAYSLIHFQFDQSHRKKMIYALADHLKQDKDLDGQFLKEGAEKTFEKNLSYINKTAFRRDQQNSFITFNSLQNQAPQIWLQDQPIKYVALFSHFIGSPGGCQKQLNFISAPDIDIRNNPHFQPMFNSLRQFITLPANQNYKWPRCANSNPNQLCDSSAGLYKDTRFVIFYAVKAEIDYKNQIFFPFNDIKLTAVSAAKPFGGLIGPKYISDTDPLSNTDPHIKELHRFYQNPPARFSSPWKEIDEKYTPNYSRFPGDKLGLRSRYVHWYWNPRLMGTGRGEKLTNYYMVDNSKLDPLARNPMGGTQHGTSILARKWELASIAPDLFDIAYFTILPYYQQVYFPKITALLNQAPYLRGDLGSYKTAGSYATPREQYLLHQAAKLGEGIRNTVWEQIRYTSPSVDKPFYKITELDDLLNSWNPPQKKYKAQTYDPNHTRFRQCDKWFHDFFPQRLNQGELGQIAGGCIYGGRTGYSVKMINPNFLNHLQDITNSQPTSWPGWR